MIAPYSQSIQDLAVEAHALVEESLPVGSWDRVGVSSGMVVRSYRPGTYVVGLVLRTAWVTLKFANGVDLLAVDAQRLLEGTGNQARHIKLRTPEQLRNPAVRAFIVAAGLLEPEPETE